MQRILLLMALALALGAAALPHPPSASVVVPGRGALTPEMFGARPDDAVDDSDALNAMIRRASADGRPASIPRGVYIVDRPLLLRSNLTIVGAPGAILRAGPDLHAGGMVRSAILSAGTGRYAQTRISLRGLTFDGANQPLIAYEFLIRLFSVDTLSITDCVFENHRFGLVAIAGSRSVGLARDQFRNWGRPDAVHEGGPGLWIAGNLIAGDETPTRGVLATALDFRDSEWTAINLFARDAVLRGGTIRNVKEAGIYGQGIGHSGAATPADGITAHVEISGYVISHVVRKDVSASAIEIGGEGISIHDNRIFDTEDAGIKLNWPLRNVLISRNQVYDTVKGRIATPVWKTVANYGQITVLQWPSSAVSGVVIRANTVGRPGLKPSAAYAIKLLSLAPSDHMADVEISQNDVANGFATAPFGFLNTPLPAAQLRSSIHDNIGAAPAH